MKFKNSEKDDNFIINLKKCIAAYSKNWSRFSTYFRSLTFYLKYVCHLIECKQKIKWIQS